MTTMTTVVAVDRAFGSLGERVIAAERRLYDAEIALHVAHQTHVDAWIAAAAERLHEAVVEHLSAVEAAVTARNESDGPVIPR